MGINSDNGVKKTRQSNIELCRIICMLLIIAHHSVIHGGAIKMETCFNKYLSFFLIPGGKICFVTFMVISTWFLVDRQLNLERFFKTWVQVLFYSVLFAAISVILGTVFSWRNWFSVIFPITGNSHGFAATYLAFYLLIPFLGMIAKKITKIQLGYLIILLFYYQVISKILGKINDYQPPLLSSELLLFVLFYFISLWLKRYTPRITVNKKAMAGIFMGVWFSVFGIWCLSLTKFAETKFFSLLFTLISDESAILCILGGYAFFFLFKNIQIPVNNSINIVAHASFGVLLFHDHNFFRYQLWEHVLGASNWYYRKSFILWVVLCVLGIYIVGMIIDKIRESITECIFNAPKIKQQIKLLERKIQ